MSMPEESGCKPLTHLPDPQRHSEDEVDRIAREWEAVTPEINTYGLHVFSRISRITWHLDALRRDAFAQVGLDGWEFDVLSALRRAGAPYELTPGALSQDTLVTSGTMTARVDKLQARGLVTKRPAPGDGRSVVIRLSPEGIELVDRAISELVEREHRILEALPNVQHAQLAESLRALLCEMEPLPSNE